MLLEDGAGFLALQLGNFNFALPVLVHLLQFHVISALVNELNWVRSVILELNDNCFLSLDIVPEFLDFGFSLVNVRLLLNALGCAVMQFLLDVLGVLLGLS